MERTGEWKNTDCVTVVIGMKWKWRLELNRYKYVTRRRNSEKWTQKRISIEISRGGGESNEKVEDKYTWLGQGTDKHLDEESKRRIGMRSERHGTTERAKHTGQRNHGMNV